MRRGRACKQREPVRSTILPPVISTRPWGGQHVGWGGLLVLCLGWGGAERDGGCRFMKISFDIPSFSRAGRSVRNGRRFLNSARSSLESALRSSARNAVCGSTCSATKDAMAHHHTHIPRPSASDVQIDPKARNPPSPPRAQLWATSKLTSQLRHGNMERVELCVVRVCPWLDCLLRIVVS